jgi:hypothetical protein
METLPDIKKLERQVYQTVYRDGIYDITLGFLFLVIAFNPLLYKTGVPRAIIYLIELVLAGSILIVGKRYITLPRAGIMKPLARRQKTAWKVLLSGIILFILLTSIILLKSFGILSLSLENLSITPLIISLAFLILFTILAAVMSYFMIFLAGLLFAISIPISEILFPILGEPLDSLIPFAASGLIILVIGMIRLFSFIHKYPCRKEEVDYEE